MVQAEIKGIVNAFLHEYSEKLKVDGRWSLVDGKFTPKDCVYGLNEHGDVCKLYFNYGLMKSERLTVEKIKEVVIHELIHIYYPNHGASFKILCRIMGLSEWGQNA